MWREGLHVGGPGVQRSTVQGADWRSKGIRHVRVYGQAEVGVRAWLEDEPGMGRVWLISPEGLARLEGGSQTQTRGEGQECEPTAAVSLEK